MNAPQFFLGTAMPSWLPRAGVPLFISDTRLRERKIMPCAAAPWAADSGGFSELQRHGRWTVTPAEYVARLYRYRDEIGSLRWAAYAGTDLVHCRLITHGDRKVAGRVH